MKKYYLLTLLFIFFDVKILYLSKVCHFNKIKHSYKNIFDNGLHIRNQTNENQILSVEKPSKNVRNSDEIKNIGHLLSLDTLFTSVGCLRPKFHCDSLHYRLDVGFHINKLFLYAKNSQNGRPIEIELRNLHTGNSKYAISVAQEDDVVPKTYIITIHRESHISDIGIPL